MAMLNAPNLGMTIIDNRNTSGIAVEAMHNSNISNPLAAPN